jgi:SET domain-containing protein
MPVSTASKPYRIGRSKTGLGLFATQPIKKGVKIVQYFGPLLDSKNEKHDSVENKYLFQISKRWTVDGSIRKNIARYINHSCKPNAESDVNAAKKKIIIRSIKKIEPGEEINYDYGTEYFKEYLKPIGCKCEGCEAKHKKKRAKLRAEKVMAKEKAARKEAKQAEKAKRKKDKAKAKKADVKKALKKAPKAAAKKAKAKVGKKAKTSKAKSKKA